MTTLKSLIKRPWRNALAAAVIWTATLSFVLVASARAAENKFSIYSGADLADASANLDVGYVPTPIEIVNEMFSLSAVGPKDFLIDMGSGDGRFVITAAKRFGTRGLGVDLNPKHYQDISGTARNQGQQWPLFNTGLVGDRIRFSLSSEV